MKQQQPPRAEERYFRLGVEEEREREAGPDDERSVCEACGVVCTRRCCFYAAALLTLYATLAATGLVMWYVRRELDAAPPEWLGGAAGRRLSG
jgi:hypothetical protein